MARVLIVGESWVTSATHLKGFDQFTTVSLESGVSPLRGALEQSGHDVRWMPSHEAHADFPSHVQGLEDVDVLFLSDIGANTLLLHPATFQRGERFPNRLQVIRDWTENGGGLVMCGGYYSFQGIGGAAFYRGTPVEAALPVTIQPYDDRVEVPEGAAVDVLEPGHPLFAGVGDDWPYLLGYNRVEAKPEALTLARVSGDPFLAVAERRSGRSLIWTSDIGPHWCPEAFTSWPGYAKLWANAVDWLTART